MQDFGEVDVKSDVALVNTTFHASMVAAYEPNLEVVKQNLIEKGIEFEDVQPFYKTYGGMFYGSYKDIAGYVIKTKDQTIVAYRGTTTSYDQYRDAKYGPQPIHFGSGQNPPQMVHGGFKLDYESSKTSRDEVFRKMGISDQTPIVFTGHSLGGAVAQLAAADYAAQDDDHKNNLKAVNTFGTPRVCTDKAAEYYNELIGEKTLHVMASGDPVIGVPPQGFGFAHTGHYAMMQTNSSFGFDNHLIKSYQVAVSNFDNMEIVEGDSIKSRRASITSESRSSKSDAQLSQSLWQYISQVISTVNMTQFWSQVLSTISPTRFLSQKNLIKENPIQLIENSSVNVNESIEANTVSQFKNFKANYQSGINLDTSTKKEVELEPKIEKDESSQKGFNPH